RPDAVRDRRPAADALLQRPCRDGPQSDLPRCFCLGILGARGRRAAAPGAMRRHTVSALAILSIVVLAAATVAFSHASDVNAAARARSISPVVGPGPTGSAVTTCRSR